MYNPSQMLSRAARSRQASPPAPAREGAPGPVRQVIAPPVKADSVYRQLMRRHDRMASRHIHSKGGI